MTDRWGHQINYQANPGDKTLSHMVLNSLEFIMMACFSRILGDKDSKNLSLKKAGSSISQIQQAYSVVNTNITEILLASSFEIIFQQLTRYTNMVTKFDPIDYKLFIDKRNEMRALNQQLERDDNVLFEDEKTEKDKQKEAEEEKKLREEEEKKLDEEAQQNGVSRDRVKELLNRKTEKEMKKLNAMYDEKVIHKILRLLEMFTAIALKSSDVHKFVIQVTGPNQLSTIAHLLMYCKSRHGLIILKIFNNLIQIGIDQGTLDDTFRDLLINARENVKHPLFGVATKVDFGEHDYLQFFYTYLLSIRLCQWDKRKLQSYGAYTTSCEIVRMFKTILRTTYQPLWKKKIEEVLDNFLKNIDAYPIEEFDVLISLFEGGEHNGLNIGAYGKDESGNKFTTVGFTKKWYDLSTPDNQERNNDFEICNIEEELRDKDDYLLAIYYDEEHPERNDMFLAIPDQIKLISNLQGPTHDFLLDKTRLNQFIKSLGIDEDKPEDGDTVNLTKRCIGMKILVEHIETHGDNFAKLFDDKFRDKLINFLLKECIKPGSKDNIRVDWYDQKLYAIKKLATESQNSLCVKKESSLLFGGRMMSLSVTLPDCDETYTKCFKLKGAMNYGCVTQKSAFRLLDGSEVMSTPHSHDTVAVMKGSELDTVEKLREVFKHLNVVVTSDLDLKSMHDKLKEAKEEEIAYFKSIVLLDDSNFETLEKILTQGPTVKRIASKEESKGAVDDEHEAFCKEIETFCGIERSRIDEAFKGHEKEPFAKKVRILSDVCHKDKKEDKKENKKEEKEEDNREINQIITHLTDSSTLSANMSNLTEFASNNYNSTTQSKTVKGDLFAKVYNLGNKDLMGQLRQTLSSFYNKLCRKTLSSFFDQLSLEKLLSVILSQEENFDMFLKYIQIRGHEAATIKKASNNATQYNEFLSLIKKIIEISSKHKEYSRIIDILLEKVIIEGTAKLMAKAIKDGAKKIDSVFKEDSAVLLTLNTFLLPDVIKFLTVEAADKVYKKESYIDLITVIMMIPFTFREEKDFHQTIYMTLFKLILPYVEDPEKFNDKEIIYELLNHKFLSKIFKKLPTSIDRTYNNLTNEQKVLFEIFLCMRMIEENNKEIASSYDYPE